MDLEGSVESERILPFVVDYLRRNYVMFGRCCLFALRADALAGFTSYKVPIGVFVPVLRPPPKTSNAPLSSKPFSSFLFTFVLSSSNEFVPSVKLRKPKERKERLTCLSSTSESHGRLHSGGELPCLDVSIIIKKKITQS